MQTVNIIKMSYLIFTRLRFVLVAKCVLLFGITFINVLHAGEISEKYKALRATAAEELASIAATCDQLGLSREAEFTRSCLTPTPRDRHSFTFIPVGDGIPFSSETTNSKHWRNRLIAVRKKYAQSLFALANKATEQEDGATAWRLLHETIRHDPAHAKTNTILGAKRVRESYKPSLKKGTYKHPLFGWAPGSYYRVETAHFTVTSHATAEETAELIRRLEILHQVWSQLFFNYWGNTASLSRSIDTGAALQFSKKRHRVYLFADKSEYIEQLKDKVAGVEKSLGIYADKRSESFFYAGDENAKPIWMHETTHQLFQESLPRSVAPRGKGCWLIEAVALYMESIRFFENHVTVGGFDSPRLQYARFRALNDRFIVATESLEKFELLDLQQHEDVGKLYSQSAGLAHLLIDGTDNWRQAVITALQRHYAGKYEPGDLPGLLRMPFGEIDSTYAKSLNVTDEQLRTDLAPAGYVFELSLGGTGVTDAGIASLAGRKKLRWLDLANTNVSDEGVTQLRECVGLADLNLEGTKITDHGLASLKNLTSVEYLDLSNTQITDEGLKHLSRMTKLRHLWLKGTRITDAGLASLAGFKQLETLELSDTAVTNQSLDALKSRLPKLK